jgi:hypothetical protein
MPQKPKRATETRSPFVSKDGVDLMGGPQKKLIPVCPPKFLPKIPQLGLNMGMDRRP